MPAAAKSCLYCGKGAENGAKMTNEHILGAWLGERMAKPSGRLRSVRVTGGASNPKAVRKYDTPNSAWDRTVNRVCDECNPWSDRVIDQPIRENLLRLMQGERTFLDDDAAQRIALWCAKLTVTATAADWADRNPLPPYLAQMIRVGEMPPPGFKVWIGQVEESAVMVNQVLLNVPRVGDEAVLAGSCVYAARVAGRLFLYFRQTSNEAAEESVEAWRFAAPLRPFVTELYHWQPRTCNWPDTRVMSRDFALETLVPSLLPEHWRPSENMPDLWDSP